MAVTLGPPPAPVTSRTTRVVLVAGGVLSMLLLAGGAVLGVALYRLGLTPGTQTVRVLGVAMAPTVRDSDLVTVQPYGTASPRAGDIVLMHDPYTPSRTYLKRVVALPGQTVMISQAQVIVNGSPRAEPYVDPSHRWTLETDWPAGRTPYRLGPDEYFVLGDNRDHSLDSRAFGPIHRAAITGRATRIASPLDRARAL